MDVANQLAVRAEGTGRAQHEMQTTLPQWHSVLAVGAHPDDESFGMGAVLAAFVDSGSRLAVLSFTHGEASTLHGIDGDLAGIRAEELRAAGRMLGVSYCELLDYPDGRLAALPFSALVEHVRSIAAVVTANGLLVFDEGGVTGHPDHQRATDAALAAAEISALPVLAWSIPEVVASQLNAEFGTAFAGRAIRELDIGLHVDRTRQHRAIAEHHSQSADNAVLRKRIELLGDCEWLRWLRLPVAGGE